MKFFVFVISVFCFSNFIDAYPYPLCNSVTYTGDAADDETGEIILTYSFYMNLFYYFHYLPPNYSQSQIQLTDLNVTLLQNSSLKFHGISYTEKYQGCSSLNDIEIDIASSDIITLFNQEIKFILSFIEENGEEEISLNDLCQSSKTYFVDTITVFINYLNIFNAETGEVFNEFHQKVTKDDDEPKEKNFLNGNKSVECPNYGLLTLPDAVEEICTNFEGNVTVVNAENNDTEVGQISYSIDSEFLSFSLHSTEDWYIHILLYCEDNSTKCLITLPPIVKDFQFPIQLITSFGNFYIGYIIRRKGIFFKYNYIANVENSMFNGYSEDTFTFEDPCWNQTFSYPKLNGIIKSLVCCTKFDSSVPTTTMSFESTEMTTLISKATTNTTDFSTVSTPNTLDKSSKNKPPIILIIAGSIGGLLLIILLIILYFYRKKKQQRKALDKMTTSTLQTNILKNLRPDFANFLLPKISHTVTDYDEFEIEWNKLIFTTSVLGCGAFGHIIQGKLINGSTKNGIYEHDITDVAIKMPHKTASDSICASFLDEIKLMKIINGNKNIIKMIGYVTKGPRICLVLEYCCHRDLLHYCKQLKKEEQNFDEIKRQTEKEFFIFTWQISHGMQFLASKNIIHCDLAARNILIGKDKNAKISDFGLSVQVESDYSIIVKDDTQKLPIKWLSFETLKFQQFSLNSDIWSFGVLLYEIYSFGNTPYDEIDEYSVLLQHLEDGNRLEKPIFCTDKTYILMRKCWNSIPTLRPTIHELIQTFKEFLEGSTEGYGYLKLLDQ